MMKTDLMKLSVRIALAVLVFVVVLHLRPPGDAAPRVFRMSDGKVISYGEMISEVKGTSLIFVGEIHTNEEHHRFELDIIRSLNEERVPLSVGFEMFKTESQKALDGWVDGTLPTNNFIRVYYANWGMPWPLYRDLLEYIRKKRIPAVALNVPEEISRKVDESGFSSLTDKELAMLPPGISCSVDREYMEFIKRAYQAHDPTEGRFVNFCEAQMLWNKTMAWNLVGYLAKHPAREVVVVTGTGHAWKRAIPAQVTVLSAKTRYTVILPEVPGYIDPKNMTPEDTDYILLTQ